MKKPVRTVLIGDADIAYKKLCAIVAQQKSPSDESKLLASIERKVALLKTNEFAGDNIPKRQIPKSYGVQNLWRLELTGYWRMLYTIKGDEIEVVCFLLDLLDHPSYDKRFGYKKC